jgi:hypothetical protein
MSLLWGASYTVCLYVHNIIGQYVMQLHMPSTAYSDSTRALYGVHSGNAHQQSYFHIHIIEQSTHVVVLYLVCLPSCECIG